MPLRKVLERACGARVAYAAFVVYAANADAYAAIILALGAPVCTYRVLMVALARLIFVSRRPATYK